MNGNGNGKLLPKKRGCRSKLTKAFIKKAVAIVSKGSYASVACASLGISEGTWWRWKSEGEEQIDQGISGLQRDFCEALYKVDAECEQEVVESWVNASKDDWRAGKEFLERKHYKRWGKKEVIAHVGPDGGPLQHAVIQANLKEVMDDTGRNSILAAWCGNILGKPSRSSDDSD